jgi:hypothetical protein
MIGFKKDWKGHLKARFILGGIIQNSVFETEIYNKGNIFREASVAELVASLRAKPQV